MHVEQRQSKKLKTKAKRQLFEDVENSESIQGIQKPTISTTAHIKEEMICEKELPERSIPTQKFQNKPFECARPKHSSIEQVNVFKYPPLPLNLDELENVRGLSNTTMLP